MKFQTILAGIVLSAVAVCSRADLTPYKDYEISDVVWYVTTVKVAPNMGDLYLEGLKRTLLRGIEVQKKLGHIEDFKIFASDFPSSGDFNLMLWVQYKNTAELAPSKAKFDAFMKEFGEQEIKETTEYSQKNYPEIREITGDYLLREITLK